MTTVKNESSLGTSVDRRRRGVSPYMWVWGGVVLIYLLTLFATPNAASLTSLTSMLPYVGILALAAFGQAIVVMQRGIDFSVVGAIIMNAMVVAFLTSAGWDASLAIATTLVIGLAIGLVNGLVVVFLNLTPLVATLAANGLYLGIALLLGGGFPVAVAPDLQSFARGNIFGISTIFLLAVIFGVLLMVTLNRTVVGRRFVAAGSNSTTASAAGIPVRTYTLSAYVGAGVCYSLAGMLLASYIGDARMTMGGDYLMASIAAVVIGGTPLTGGRGSILATLGGAVFMTMLTQFVLALGAPSSVQLLVQAIVLVAAVTLPNALALLRSRRRRAAVARG